MFALISTIDGEKPYRFCETSEVKFPVTEPALFWVECGDNISPATHKYTDSGFEELPPPVTVPNTPATTQGNNFPTVM
jgi:hypothetical protein